jgi:thiol-disulfide isomerase/thioredoxin
MAFSVFLAGCAGETGSSGPAAPTEANKKPDENADEKTDADSTEKDASQPKDTAGTLAPEDVKLTKANWEEVLAEVAKYKGKVVVLDIWSVTCAPCLREFPNLVDLSRKYPERVVCLSLNTDYYGGASKPPEYYEPKARETLSKMNATFDNYLCAVPSDELFEKIELASIPAVYVFGPDGEVAERFDNDEQKYGEEFTYEKHIIPKIESLLKPVE